MVLKIETILDRSDNNKKEKLSNQMMNRKKEGNQFFNKKNI